MVLLDLSKHNYSNNVLPLYLKNGIIIDTSIIKLFIDGFKDAQISKRTSEDYNNLIEIFQFIKIEWDKLLLTPHIFTEICSHLKKECRTHKHFEVIMDSFLPLLRRSKENEVKKDSILEHKDIKSRVIEVGDISIFLTIQKYDENNQKICVFGKDGKFLDRYGDEAQENVMVIDYDLLKYEIKNIN